MTHDEVMIWLSLIVIAATMVQGILFVILGQVTVRKLRRNPATRNYLGMEFYPGWDIINVSLALSRPRRWAHLLEDSPLGFLNARSQPIRAHTTRLDRVLARMHFWSFVFAALVIYAWIAYDKLG